MIYAKFNANHWTVDDLVRYGYTIVDMNKDWIEAFI